MRIGLRVFGTPYTPSGCRCLAPGWVPRAFSKHAEHQVGCAAWEEKRSLPFFFFKALFLSHSCSAQEKYSHECEEQLPIDSGRNRCWISCPCSFRAAGGRQSAATLQLAWILPSPRILACKTDFVHFATFECTAQIDFVAVLRCTDGV